jgi:hypothetical protein
MLEDSARFQELQQKKEEAARRFNENIEDIINQHNIAVNQLVAEHNMHMEAQRSQTEQLKKEIDRLIKDHNEIKKQIEDDASNEITQIEEKNAGDLNKIQEMSLRSKADLQHTRNKHHDLESEIE